MRSTEAEIHDAATSLQQRLTTRFEQGALTRQAGNSLDYARRLASAEGELLAEEAFKLFGLMDEVDALVGLGARIEPDAWADALEAIDRRWGVQRGVCAAARDMRTRPSGDDAWRSAKPWYRTR